MVIILAVLAVGYFLFAAIGDTILSQRLNQEEQQLQRNISDLQNDQAELTAIRDYLQTNEYIEGAARRLLGLVRPGEQLYIIASSVTPTPPAPDESDDEEPKSWWEQLYGP